jgi:hypothetical protein
VFAHLIEYYSPDNEHQNSRFFLCMPCYMGWKNQMPYGAVYPGDAAVTREGRYRGFSDSGIFWEDQPIVDGLCAMCGRLCSQVRG